MSCLTRAHKGKWPFVLKPQHVFPFRLWPPAPHCQQELRLQEALCSTGMDINGIDVSTAGMARPAWSTGEQCTGLAQHQEGTHQDFIMAITAQGYHQSSRKNGGPCIRGMGRTHLTVASRGQRRGQLGQLKENPPAT